MTKVEFSEMENIIFSFACEFARNIMKDYLESNDEEIRNKRDIKRYRQKDSRKTTIKTKFGDVEYKRRYYYDRKEKRYTYLLDEELCINKIGLYSKGMADMIVKKCINESFRKVAEDINSFTEQKISGVAAWKVVQQVGKIIEKDEDAAIKKLKKGQAAGDRTVKVLFQEADGVYLHMQKDKKKAPSAELKLATIYEGVTDSSRHKLVNKTVVVGMESGSSFMTRREAIVNSIYNTDEIGIQLLNGDGGKWINVNESNMTYQQLDQYHLYQEIHRRIKNKDIKKKIIEQLKLKNTDRVLEIIAMYADSIDNNIESDKRAEEARKLYTYLYNNKGRLLKYKDVISVPEPDKGILYRNMGVQENQNCTLITKRMKNGRYRWSVSGANNLAKVICSKSNNTLDKYIKQCFDFTVPVKIVKEQDDNKLGRIVFQKKSGKGDVYKELSNSSIALFNTETNPTQKVIRDIINSYYV